MEHDRPSRCLWMIFERENEASGKGQKESFLVEGGTIMG